MTAELVSGGGVSLRATEATRRGRGGELVCGHHDHGSNVVRKPRPNETYTCHWALGQWTVGTETTPQTPAGKLCSCCFTRIEMSKPSFPPNNDPYSLDGQIITLCTSVSDTKVKSLFGHHVSIAP